MTIGVTQLNPAAVVGAYQRVQAGPDAASGGFGDVLARAVQGVVNAGHEADARSVQALSGNGNLTNVATAVSRAQLALEAATSVRDRFVQAYQDVMRMAI